MAQLTASRTLVKSSPELWAECSHAASLARHLGAFGEIQITELEPETAVAWEGDAVRGTVTLEPSGWGTRVVLTATAVPTPAVGVGEPAGNETAASEAGPEPEPLAHRDPISAAVPDLGASVEPDLSTRPGFFRRLFGGWGGSADPAASAQPAAPAGPDSPPVDPDSPSAKALVGALDSLGRAHRRPFSRG